MLANNPHPRRLAVRSAKDWSDQPRPMHEFPGGVAARAATAEALAADDLGGSDGGDPSPDLPELMPILGGFRWEYDNAIDRLNTYFAPNLKKRYDAMLQEIVPAGVDIDEHIPTGPIGGATARAPPELDLEQLPRSSTEATSAGSSSRSRSGRRSQRRSTSHFRATWTSAETPEEMDTFADDMIERLEAHELRQRPLRWLDVPGLDGVLGRDDLQLLLTSFSSGERLWQRATVQDDEPPAGITSAVYLANLSERAWADSARTGRDRRRADRPARRDRDPSRAVPEVTAAAGVPRRRAAAVPAHRRRRWRSPLTGRS